MNLYVASVPNEFVWLFFLGKDCVLSAIYWVNADFCLHKLNSLFLSVQKCAFLKNHRTSSHIWTDLDHWLIVFFCSKTWFFLYFARWTPKSSDRPLKLYLNRRVSIFQHQHVHTEFFLYQNKPGKILNTEFRILDFSDLFWWKKISMCSNRFHVLVMTMQRIENFSRRVASNSTSKNDRDRDKSVSSGTILWS